MNKDIGKLAKKANIRRNQVLSPERRKEIARKAAAVRWEKKEPIPEEKVEEMLDIRPQDESPLDRCTKCGLKRYQHSQYMSNPCGGRYATT